MLDWIASHTPAWNGWLALFLYWMPLALCAYGYLVMAVEGYRKDLAKRTEEEATAAAGKLTFYTPTLTVGLLVGYLLATVVPVVNLFAAVFYVAPRVFGDLFEWLGKVLDMPLVPGRPSKLRQPK